MLVLPSFLFAYKTVPVASCRSPPQVAVKTMRLTCTADEVAEFTEEAALQLRLKHDNIAQLVGVCMAQVPMLAVLELILYGDLLKVVKACSDKQLTLQPVDEVHLVQQIAAGMAYIASNRIVHLDLAARNCLLHANSVVKIADFGLYRARFWGRILRSRTLLHPSVLFFLTVVVAVNSVQTLKVASVQTTTEWLAAAWENEESVQVVPPRVLTSAHVACRGEGLFPGLWRTVRHVGIWCGMLGDCKQG
jgi:serine/threonine protein kinase